MPSILSTWVRTSSAPSARGPPRPTSPGPLSWSCRARSSTRVRRASSIELLRSSATRRYTNVPARTRTIAIATANAIVILARIGSRLRMAPAL